jgi:hypothetical protein
LAKQLSNPSLDLKRLKIPFMAVRARVVFWFNVKVEVRFLLGMLLSFGHELVMTEKAMLDLAPDSPGRSILRDCRSVATSRVADAQCHRRALAANKF